jgi:hypothetical protein
MSLRLGSPAPARLSLRDRRVDAEVALLRRWFRRLAYDDIGRNWVMLPRYDLPRGFNRRATPVLILIPADYPVVPPDGIFVDMGLNIPGHYFQEKGPRNPFGDKDWAWLCAHLDKRGWRPSADLVGGDNLATLLELYTTIFAAMLKPG